MDRERVVEIIQEVAEKDIGVPAAARLLGTSERTVWRKVARYREDGPDGLVHKLAGKPSNRAKPAHVRQRIAELYQQAPPEISLNKFTRSVVEGKQIRVCRETIRQWLMDAGMWKAGTRAP